MARDQTMEIRLTPRTRAVGIGFVATTVVLALIDFVLLRGETVAALSIDLRDETPSVIELTRAGEPHVMTIRSTRRVSGETKGRSLDYRLVGPNGTVIEDESEFIARRTRYLRFTPYVAGAYTLSIADDSHYSRGSSSYRTASVRVSVNDRRVLPRLFGF